MKKRLLCLCMSAILALGLFAACGGGATTGGDATGGGAAPPVAGAEVSERPFEGVTISVLVPATPYVDTLRRNIQEFTDLTGIRVDFEQLENDQLSNRIAVNAAAGGTELDVIFYRPIQENLAFTARGWLENLDPFIAAAGDDYNYMDFTESAREITSANGSAFGIPLVTERMVVQFNIDMLAQVGYDSIPDTFDEFVALCEALLEAGITPLGIRGEGNAAVTQFSGFLYGFGGDFIDYDTGTALINTDEFIRALQFYGMLADRFAPMGVLNAGWPETQNWFAQGQVAMRIDADSQYAYALDPNASLVYDRVGYGVIPGETRAARAPFSIVAWAVGISSGSRNTEASWEFIRWATSKEMDVIAQQEGNFSARHSTWANPEASRYIPPSLVVVVEESNQIARPFDRPYMENAAEARAAIGTLITMAIEGVTEEQLRAAAEDVNALVQRLLDEERNA